MTGRPQFRIDNGDPVIVTSGLYLDPRRPRPLAFVSHGHALRSGPHTRFITTPETAALCTVLGPVGRHETIRFAETCRIGRHTVTLFPAGHMLGSAMLHIETPVTSILYTGDFRLSPALTAEAAAPPKAQTLIMEGTFGDPRFRFPSREEVSGQLSDLVRRLLSQGATPVIFAYSAGKAQEVLASLAHDELTVFVSSTIERVSAIYRLYGKNLGSFRVVPENIPSGSVLVLSPQVRNSPALTQLRKLRTIAVTGWAMDRRYATRSRYDYALPLSDHAGHDELLELVHRVSPKEIYLLNGPRTFLSELKSLGYQAAMASSLDANPLLSRQQATT